MNPIETVRGVRSRSIAAMSTPLDHPRASYLKHVNRNAFGEESRDGAGDRKHFVSPRNSGAPAFPGCRGRISAPDRHASARSGH